MELQSPDAHSIDDEPPLNFEDILTERQRIDRVTQGLLATQDSDVLFTRTRESSPNYIIVKDSDVLPPAQLAFSALLPLGEFRNLSPGTIADLDADGPCSQRYYDDANFEKEFCTPRKRVSRSGGSVVAPDISPIGLDEEEQSPLDHPCVVERRGSYVRMPKRFSLFAFAVDAEAGEGNSHRMPDEDKENVPVGASAATLSQSGADSSFGIDDTGYHSNNPASFKSLQSCASTSSLSFASVANSTTFCPSSNNSNDAKPGPTLQRCSSMLASATSDSYTTAPRQRRSGVVNCALPSKDAGAVLLQRRASFQLTSRGTSVEDDSHRVLARQRTQLGSFGGWRGSIKPFRSSVDDHDTAVLMKQKANAARRNQRAARRVSELGLAALVDPESCDTKKHRWRTSSRRPSVAAIDSWRSQPSILSEDSLSTSAAELSHASSSSSMASDSNGGENKGELQADLPLEFNFGSFR